MSQAEAGLQRQSQHPRALITSGASVKRKIASVVSQVISASAHTFVIKKKRNHSVITGLILFDSLTIQA